MVASSLLLLLVLLALFPPVRAEGQLPELGERPAEMDCRVPLICLGPSRIVGQVQRLMTILFSDIRAFSTLSETMSPQENFNFLNAYLGRVSPIGCHDDPSGDLVQPHGMLEGVLIREFAACQAGRVRRNIRDWQQRVRW